MRESVAAPPVFRDLTQAELDRAYDQRAWAPNAAAVIEGYATRSAETRRRLPHRAGLAYGPSPAETLDIFPAAAAKAPIQLFLHGGAWQQGSKDSYSFPAETFVPAGAIYVAVNFANIPEARLPEMADQIRRAVLWTHRNAVSFGGDPDRLFISGHSSGGHLAAVLLTTDWRALGAPGDIIKGAVCISGLYDLEPVLLSSRSSYVKLSADEVADLSPIRHPDRIACPVAVTHGGKESPEFQRQARDFAAALGVGRHISDYQILADLNHFEMADSLADPRSPLSRLALRQMRLLPA